jgi:hypothetical protein
MSASIADRLHHNGCSARRMPVETPTVPRSAPRWTASRRLPTIGRHSHDRQPFLKPLILGTLALAVSTALFAAAAVPNFDPHRLSDEVKTLSSDAFEGRGPATPAETKTIDYVVAQMKAAGLQPGGDLTNGTRAWTQACR